MSRGYGLRGLFSCLPQVGGEDPLTLLPIAWHEVLDLPQSLHETSWMGIKGLSSAGAISDGAGAISDGGW